MDECWHIVQHRCDIDSAGSAHRIHTERANFSHHADNGAGASECQRSRAELLVSGNFGLAPGRHACINHRLHFDSQLDRCGRCRRFGLEIFAADSSQPKSSEKAEALVARTYGRQQNKMYLMDSSAPAVSNTKWRLRGMGRLGLSPVRLPNLGASSTAQSWRMRGLRGLGRLGDAGNCVYYGADGVTVESIDTNTDVVECAGNGGAWNAARILNMPVTPGVQNPSPVAGSASNGRITTVPATTPSTNPLDYTSPQAAVAAGLDANTVMAAWTKSLARFPSPQAAISAGVPAGVVNQLWQQSQVNAANTAAASAASSASLMSILPWAAGGLLLLATLGGGKGRR